MLGDIAVPGLSLWRGSMMAGGFVTLTTMGSIIQTKFRVTTSNTRVKLDNSWAPRVAGVLLTSNVGGANTFGFGAFE